MSEPLPPGQPPIDPRSAFAPPPPPPGSGMGQMQGGPPRPPAGWPGGTQGFGQGGVAPGGFGQGGLNQPAGNPGGFGGIPPGGIGAMNFPPGAMPGGGMFPPMMMPPPPPRRGWGFAGPVIILLLIVLIGSLLLNGALMMNAATAGGMVKQVTVIDGDSSQKIAVIPVEGLITDDMAAQFDRFFTQAEKDSTVKAVVLAVDTPGGSATSSDTMYHRIGTFRKRMDDAGRKIPVVVTMGGMGTSGGYYVSCGADYIFCRHATMTANIGVIMPQFNFAKLLNKWGIDDTTIVATGGVYKDAGSMFRPVTDFDRNYLQGLIDATFDQFKQVVLTGRKGKLVGTAPYPDIFNGKVFMGDEALKTGLVDQIGYADDAYAYAATAAGISKPDVVRYEAATGLLRLLDSDSAVTPPKADGQTVQIDGVNVNIRQLADLLRPKPMYLWGAW